MARICLILDEDMEGNITLAEYQNALEAYGCSGETHFDPNGGENYIVFQIRAMFKLLSVMEDRKMTEKELFSAIDTDRSETIKLSELVSMLNSLSSLFSEKDLHAIYNFFDVDQDGEISHKEFITQIAKSMKLHQNHLSKIDESPARPATA